MAEKKERILHIVQKLDGRFVGENRITRSESIECMAKALAFAQAKTFVNKDQWEIVMRCCRYEAEAALDALLED